MLVYEHAGLDAERGAPSKGLSAHDFASADVVLTTYETLQKDVNRQGNVTTYALRQAKKYEVRSILLSPARQCSCLLLMVSLALIYKQLLCMLLWYSALVPNPFKCGVRCYQHR